MNKKQALRLLKEQKAKVSQNEIKNQETVLRNFSYFTSIFGKDSIEYQRLYLCLNQGVVDTEQLIKVFNSAIESVEYKGTLSKGNFLSRMSEGWLGIVITFLIPSIFFAGYWAKSIEIFKTSAVNETHAKSEQGERLNDTIKNEGIHKDSFKN